MLLLRLSHSINFQLLRPALKAHNDTMSSKFGGARIANFLMCWLALCGLANAAFGVAALSNTDIKLTLFQQPATTPTQKLTYFVIYFALSAVGFSYMLWRYNWRCRLSTLLKIAALCCVLLATGLVLRTDTILQGQFMFFGTVIFALLYSLSWSQRHENAR